MLMTRAGMRAVRALRTASCVSWLSRIPLRFACSALYFAQSCSCVSPNLVRSYSYLDCLVTIKILSAGMATLPGDVLGDAFMIKELTFRSY